eukprot:1155212-Pelagomonas_calceolata.AAC.9
MEALLQTCGHREALGPGLAAKPLEQEPLLAARIMIEDCLHLMLDVDDIDRRASHLVPSCAGSAHCDRGLCACLVLDMDNIDRKGCFFVDGQPGSKCTLCMYGRTQAGESRHCKKGAGAMHGGQVFHSSICMSGCAAQTHLSTLPGT